MNKTFKYYLFWRNLWGWICVIGIIMGIFGFISSVAAANARDGAGWICPSFSLLILGTILGGLGGKYEKEYIDICFGDKQYIWCEKKFECNHTGACQWKQRGNGCPRFKGAV